MSKASSVVAKESRTVDVDSHRPVDDNYVTESQYVRRQ